VRVPLPPLGTGYEDSSGLLARERGTGAEVRVPFDTSGAQARALLVREPGLLPEGRWDLYAEYGSETGPVLRRLRAGLRDLRALLPPLAAPPRLPVVSWVPYRTSGGWLALRTWERYGHAEVQSVHVSRDEFAVEGWLLGQGRPAPPAVELRCRRGCDRALPTVVSARPAPSPAWEGTGQGFRSSLLWTDLAEIASEGEVWDLYALPYGATEAVRVARLLDDIPDKKDVYSFPDTHVWAPGRGPLRIRPYYTQANGLSVKAESLEGI
jgi:hypothetical protein